MLAPDSARSSVDTAVTWPIPRHGVRRLNAAHFELTRSFREGSSGEQMEWMKAVISAEVPTMLERAVPRARPACGNEVESSTMTSTDPAALHIDVVSDVVCPWCFIGKRRLETALTLVPDIAVEINWRPYFLNPWIPREGIDRQPIWRPNSVRPSVTRLSPNALSQPPRWRASFTPPIPSTGSPIRSTAIA